MCSRLKYSQIYRTVTVALVVAITCMAFPPLASTHTRQRRWCDRPLYVSHITFSKSHITKPKSKAGRSENE
jgi:hypothetical protein